MAKILVVLTVWITILFSLPAAAQEKKLTFKELEYRLSAIKNPFKSQLPEPEIEDETAKTDPEPMPPQPTAEPESLAPMQPAISSPETIAEIESVAHVPDVTISGIIWNTDRPQAIINGQIMEIGDKILEIEITDIHKTGVNGTFQGRPVTFLKHAKNKGANYETYENYDE